MYDLATTFSHQILNYSCKHEDTLTTKKNSESMTTFVIHDGLVLGCRT
jgi:hypothetical protein